MAENEMPELQPVPPAGAKKDAPPPGGENQPDLAFAEPGEAGKPKEEGEYRLAGEAGSQGKKAAQAADWYYMVGQQARQGPVSLDDLQRLVAAGRLGRQDRVWRSGLAEWVAVADVPELHEEPGPPPPPQARPVVLEPTPGALDFLRPIERGLTDPAVLRITGWACGLLGVLLLLLSVPLAFFGHRAFTEALLFLLGFMVFQALARVVESSPKS